MAETFIFLMLYGVPAEASMNYDPFSNPPCKAIVPLITPKKFHRIVPRSAPQIKAAIVKAPIVMCLSTFCVEYAFYAGGIFDKKCDDISPGLNHAVIAVGFDSVTLKK